MLLIKKSRIVVMLIFLAGITLSCQDFNESRERVIDYKDYYYEIDPNMIIDDIDDGNKGVFRSVPNDFQESVSVERGWTQEDFFKVIDALAETRLPDSFMQYRLDYLSADYKCDQVGKAPWRLTARYNLESKSGDIDQWERYLVHIIPEIGYLHVSYQLWQPLLSSRVTMDKKGIKVPFEEAIQIANENGGQAYIDKHEKNCSVYIDLFPKSGNRLIWKLRYQGPKWYATNDFVEVFVDAVTGKAHKKTFFDFLLNQ